MEFRGQDRRALLTLKKGLHLVAARDAKVPTLTRASKRSRVIVVDPATPALVTAAAALQARIDALLAL